MACHFCSLLQPQCSSLTLTHQCQELASAYDYAENIHACINSYEGNSLSLPEYLVFPPETRQPILTSDNHEGNSCEWPSPYKHEAQTTYLEKFPIPFTQASPANPKDQNELFYTGGPHVPAPVWALTQGSWFEPKPIVELNTLESQPIYEDRSYVATPI